MNYSLLCLDLDGTLLDKKKRIDTYSIPSLQEFTKQNGQILIATGRHFVTASKYHNEIKQLTNNKCNYLITLDGSAVYKDNELDEKLSIAIDEKIVKEFIALCNKYKLKYIIYLKEMLVNKTNNVLTNSKLIKTISKHYKKIDALIDFEPKDYSAFKLNVSGISIKKINLLISELNQKFSGQLNFFCMNKRFYEIVAIGASKGNAIKAIAKNLDISLANTAAAGDNNNDLSMLKTVKLFGAINSSSIELNKSCSIEIKFKKGGVGKFVENCILKPAPVAKILISDVDGTLITKKEKIICDETKDILKKTIGTKIPFFCICTGRNVVSSYEILSSIGLKTFKNTYIIANNGSVIYEVNSNKIIYKNLMSQNDAKPVFELIKKAQDIMTIGAIIHPCVEQEIRKSIDSDLEYIPNLYTINRLYILDLLKKVNLISKSNPEDSFYELPEIGEKMQLAKFVIYFSSIEDKTKFLKMFKEQNINVDISSSNKFNIEITPKFVSKGTAVKILCNALDISTDKIIICGDELNDISMLKLTEWSYTMESSNVDTKLSARHIINAEPSYFVCEAVKNYLSLIKSRND